MGVSMTKWEGPIFTGEKDFKGSLAVDTNPGGEKVTNGSFTGNADGWTLTAGWTYSANTVLHDGNGTTTLSQDVSAVANDIYRVEYVVSAWSVGTVTVAVGGVSGTARGADGTYVEYITATGTGSLTFTPTNTARFTLDTISVKRVGVVAADRVTLWAGDRIAAGVEQAGDAGLFVRSEDGTLNFIGDTTQIGGTLLINATAAYGRNSQKFEVNQSADEGGAALNTWSATAAEAAMLDFNRSKSATIGTHAVVASGDALGFITFRGSDAAAGEFIEAAQIRTEVDGTPGDNDMPGRLLFYTTADGAASVTERMRIDSRGRLSVGGGAYSIDSTLILEETRTAAGAAFTSSIVVASTLTAAANQNAAGFYCAPTLVEAGSGTHASFASARFAAPTVTSGDAALTAAATVKIDGAPTGGVSNYALWVETGYSEFDGSIGYKMPDNAGTPVAATAALKMFAHNKSVADDGIITLPLVTTCGFGVVMCDTDVSERTQFWVDSTGTVTLVNNAGSVVANADTDTNLCIGTAATQEPLQVKNRLGATKVVNVIFWYD